MRAQSSLHVATRVGRHACVQRREVHRRSGAERARKQLHRSRTASSSTSGSTDTSADHCHSRRGKLATSRIRVISLPHRGLAATRNEALEEARGELIANLDADDVMFHDRLTTQVAYLDRHPDCVAVGTRALVVNAKGQPISIGVRHFTHEEIDGANLSGRQRPPCGIPTATLSPS